MGFERDPTLYSGSARFYLEGWLAYAPSMADTPVRTLGLDGTGRLLDVGCGAGRASSPWTSRRSSRSPSAPNGPRQEASSSRMTS
jgi:hypothetical protein